MEDDDLTFMSRSAPLYQAVDNLPPTLVLTNCKMYLFQGRLVEKDFDVLRTAGGSTNRAVHRVYKANVTENYIEVHLFWAGKGTCCIPIQGAYGPIISAVSAAPGNTQ